MEDVRIFLALVSLILSIILGVITIVKPLIKLTHTLQQLNYVLTQLKEEVDKFKLSNSERHKQLFEEIREIKNTLTEFNIRLSLVEQELNNE